MNKIVIIDDTKNVQLASIHQLFGYCGTIESIETFTEEEFTYFIVSYKDENEASTAMYMNNTLVDNSQIKVKSYNDFYESYISEQSINKSNDKSNQHNQLNQINQSIHTSQIQSQETIEIDENEQLPTEKKESTKEKLNQKAKHLGEKTQTAFNHFQCFIVDRAVDTRNAFDKIRKKEQLPQYDLPQEYTHSESFEKKTFVVSQQKSSPSLEQNEMIDSDNDIPINQNNLKKKPLPPIPPQK